MFHKQQTGRLGEDLAAAFITAKGYRLLERNYRTPFGELDIIARDGQAIVFVEVRTCRTADFIEPVESVGRRKKEHLVRAANYWLLAKEINNQTALRFDLVAIVLEPAGQTSPRIDHLVGFLEV